ncbi:MAG: ArsR/SmtB family transcription factor [Candidatus Eisenbacteria bacterium]|nr:winged helix-turn-helix domain-containing protein [Candidatus Eisenbacteria bacterium]
MAHENPAPRAAAAGPGATAAEIERMREQIRGLGAMDPLAEAFAALGSAPRLRLLYLLYHRPDLSVGQLASLAGLSVSGVSMHLARLKRSGLVNCRRDGQTICCALTGENDHVIFLRNLFRSIATQTGCCQPLPGGAKEVANAAAQCKGGVRGEA